MIRSSYWRCQGLPFAKIVCLLWEIPPLFTPCLKKRKNTLQKQAFLAKKGFFCGVFEDFVLLGCFSQVADCQLKKL